MSIFKNRKFTVTVDKRDKEQLEENFDAVVFEQKSDSILKSLERVGTKIFFGACALIVLSTACEIAKTKATEDSDQ